MAGNSSLAGMPQNAVTFEADELKFALRTLLYLVTPNETSFEAFEEVPNYFLKAMTYLPLWVFGEIIALAVQGRKQPSFGDALCSMCCGLLIFLPVAIVGQMELNMYIYCYEKFRLIDLPWNSSFTWVLGLLGADLGFYWWHRAGHEINFIWAFHQVHHTSQEYNLTVGIRLPSFNRYVAILFYLPCALILPPSVFYVHYQLNYIFQFWIHTDVLPTFGILDYFIVNPSLHRVHHGRNRYCIDKNYAALFSIWDIIFGTFERERPGEEIYYGLVHTINSFDPIYIQFHHLKSIFQNALQRDGILNKIYTFSNGPGWRPGLPRLGDYKEIPKVPEDKEAYSIYLPLWVKFYLSIHYLVTFLVFLKIKVTKSLLPMSMVWLHGGFVLWAMITTGMFLERRPSAVLFEGLRCAFYFVIEILLQNVLTADPYFLYTMRIIFFASILICASNLKLFTGKDIDKKLKTQ
jgi:alkylglycerol monooxygenase